MSRDFIASVHESLELQGTGDARLLSMEGLRGVAVSLVFIQHFAYQALLLGHFDGIGLVAMQALRGYGNLGVELFFVLSGYLIYGALLKRGVPVLRFMRRRVQRIYPAFLVAFLIYIAAVELGGMEGKIPRDPMQAILFFASNLLFLPGLFPLPILMSVAWSLSYEMFFYLVCGSVARVLKLYEKSNETRLRGVVAVAIAFYVACLLFSWMPVRMLPFFAGMLLAEGIGVARFRAPEAVGLIAPFIALAISRMNILSAQPTELMHTVAFFFLGSACLSGPFAGRLLSWTPLRLLGNMSYSYYLMHGLTVISLSILTGRTIGTDIPTWVLWSTLPFVFVLSLIPAYLLFLLIERPISLQPRARGPALA